MRRIALLLTVGLVVTACLGTDFADSVEGAWELDAGSLDGEPIPILDSHPITMTLEGDQISGKAACNSYGGRFLLDGNEFSIQEGLAWTEMACMPQEVMESEQAFLQALTRVDTVEMGDERLTLAGPDVEMSFELLPPVPTADLTGTLWVLDGLVQNDAVTSPIQGERATLELSEDGTFTGSTGCRAISGTYQITGAEVLFTEFAAEGDCSSQLQEQDSRVISALEGGFRVEIEGSRMTTSSAGDEGLVYRAEG